MSIENDPLIGTQLGAYQVQGKLGEGGMARVYKAYHPRLRREVAIKVILSQVADREGFQARFEQEAQLIASLEHPNIVGVYDFGEAGNLTYLVMQYVGGGTLRNQLRNGQPLELQRATHYTIQMARALHHAHQRGIVHRDVKPQNMLVPSTDRNHLLLSDFGIAKLFRGVDDATVLSQMPTRAVENDSSLTGVDQIIGTADYMAPEQANALPVDARTDVYALGVVLYQMLTGEVPFHSTTLRGLLFQHVYTPPPSVRAKNPLIPEILAQITSKALAKAPDDRFPTAEAMAQALEAANANDTNMMGSLASGGQSGNAYPSTNPYTLTQPDYTIVRQREQDSYALSSDALTAPGLSNATAISRPAQSITDPALANKQSTTVHRRRFSPTYLITATVLIIGLAILGFRVYQNQSGTGTGAGSNSSQATAFNDTFRDNTLNWPTGSLNGSASASSPGGGAYQISISAQTTAFPYPQNVGTLPATFTLTATIGQTSGSANLYGIAFHFKQGSSGITSYALAANNSGGYMLLEYKTPNTPLEVAQGSYQADGKSAHTFQVQAKGNSYSFSVDGQTLSFAIGSNAPTTTWQNSDLNSGTLALYLTGSASYTATHVQLSLS